MNRRWVQKSEPIRRPIGIKLNYMTRAFICSILVCTLTIRAQDPTTTTLDFNGVEHPECIAFGTARGTLNPTQNGAKRAENLSHLTTEVNRLIGPRTEQQAATNATPSNLIDQYIFPAIDAAGVTPAGPTTDWEFVRRATLDLTGRIPDPQRVVTFVNDPSPTKRAALVDELLAKAEWVDKWTIFYADLYKNNSRNTQIQRFITGVTAFNTWIRTSLTTAKPYDQMARELIASSGGSTYTTGQLNFLIGGVVSGGPQQDIWDQQTTNISEALLGISHTNCLLCHNGRGHLDALSLWGSQTLRQQAWGLSAFLSRTEITRTEITPGVTNPAYFSLNTNTTRYKTDYPLNTTTGNRPARQPYTSIDTGKTISNSAPVYLFTGETPKPGEDYRVALGRIMTSDFQFARASVNYMWEAFFGIGLVNPSNQFDPDRLDPDNPPSGCADGTPCTLQPSNPQLLNALAQYFIDNKYDIKSLQRLIANSRAYQLSSSYDGTWNLQWTTLFARKSVRRLWAEEVHDAISKTSQLMPTYKTTAWGPVNWAMQLPEPQATPDGVNGPVARFLDSFLRGDRDTEPRRSDGAITQALNLLNDPFVLTRTRAATANGLLAKEVASTTDNTALTNVLFLNALSRYPNSIELSTALKNVQSASSRTAGFEDLYWSLYNKVDFFFNY